jgi:hypothetical protein
MTRVELLGNFAEALWRADARRRVGVVVDTCSVRCWLLLWVGAIVGSCCCCCRCSALQHKSHRRDQPHSRVRRSRRQAPPRWDSCHHSSVSDVPACGRAASVVWRVSSRGWCLNRTRRLGCVRCPTVCSVQCAPRLPQATVRDDAQSADKKLTPSMDIVTSWRDDAEANHDQALALTSGGVCLP